MGESMHATAGHEAYAVWPAVPRASESASTLPRLHCKVALRAAQSWRWVSSSHRAVDCDIRLDSWYSRSLRASRCCFFEAVARSLPSVSIGFGASASRVVSCVFVCPRCRLPAVVVGVDAKTDGAGEMAIEPSRRHVTVTPSLRERRAAWRRSCHWRALSDPREPAGRAGCLDGIVDAKSND